MLSDRKKRWVLFSGLISLFLSVAMLYQMSPFFQTYAEETANVDAATLGVIFSVLPFASFVASMPAASLVNKYGTRICLSSGLLILALSSLMFGLSDSAAAWIFWRAVQGFASASIYSSVAVTFATTFHAPGEFSKVNGMQEALLTVGFAVGPALGGALFQYGGFFCPFAACAAVHLLFVGLSCLVPSKEECEDDEDDKVELLLNLDIEEVEEEAEEAEAHLGLWDILTPEVVLIIPAGMIFCGIFGALDPVYAKHLGRTLNSTSPAVVGMVMSLPSLPSIVLALVVPMLMEKFTGHTVMTFGVGMLFVICMLLALSDPDSEDTFGWSLPVEAGGTSQWVLQIVLSCGMGCASAIGWTPVFPDMMEKAVGRVSKDRGLSREQGMAVASATVSSLFSMCTALGEGLGPVCGGVLMKHLGFAGTYTLVGSLIGLYFFVLCIAPWSAIPVYPLDYYRSVLPATSFHNLALNLTPARYGQRPAKRSGLRIRTKLFGDVVHRHDRAVTV